MPKGRSGHSVLKWKGLGLALFLPVSAVTWVTPLQEPVILSNQPVHSAPVGLHWLVLSKTRNKTSYCTDLDASACLPLNSQMLLWQRLPAFLCQNLSVSVEWESLLPRVSSAMQELRSRMYTITFVIQPLLQIPLLCCPYITIPILLVVDDSPITLAPC